MKPEKLIVKNFGPIKNAEIEIGRVTLFIGEQASGKSVLAKLIAIAKDRRLLTQCIMEQYVEVRTNHVKNLFKDYQVHRFFKTDTLIEYHFDTFKIEWEKDIKRFVPTEEGLIDRLSLLKKSFKSMSFEDKNNKIEEIIHDPHSINHSEFTTINREAIYIPAERLLFSMIQTEIMALLNNDIKIPKSITRFGSAYNLAKRVVRQLNINFLELNYIYDANREDLIKGQEYTIPINEASSGIQTIVPLLVTMEYYVNIDNLRGFTFVLEEPELNLFPTTQYKLVNQIVAYYNRNKSNKLVLTSHSPYILTALNNSIQAKNVIKHHPQKAQKVGAILNAKYHLDYDDVKAYYIVDGIAKPIMNEEYQTIDANRLDHVSDELGAVFDELLDLKYEN